MLCYAVLCYVMLCYVMLCDVMLCYVMLCSVMLCYVMLCDLQVDIKPVNFLNVHFTAKRLRFAPVGVLQVIVGFLEAFSNFIVYLHIRWDHISFHNKLTEDTMKQRSDSFIQTLIVSNAE